MNGHDNAAFSTKDQDNDGHGADSCALTYKGAWWYNACHDVDLNGLYHKGTHTKAGEGVMWRGFKGDEESLEWTEIKIRPKNARTSFASQMTYNL